MRVHDVKAGLVMIEIYEREALALVDALDVALNSFGYGYATEYDRLEGLQAILKAAGTLAHWQAHSLPSATSSMSETLRIARDRHEGEYAAD